MNKSLIFSIIKLMIKKGLFFCIFLYFFVFFVYFFVFFVFFLYFLCIFLYFCVFLSISSMQECTP